MKTNPANKKKQIQPQRIQVFQKDQLCLSRLEKIVSTK